MSVKGNFSSMVAIQSDFWFVVAATLPSLCRGPGFAICGVVCLLSDAEIAASMQGVRQLQPIDCIQVSEELLEAVRQELLAVVVSSHHWQLPPAVPSSQDNYLLSSISHISAGRAAVIHPPCRVWIGLRLRSTFPLGLNDKQDVETQCFDRRQQPIRHLNSLCSLAERLDGLVTHKVTMVYCRLDFGALAVYWLSLLLYWQQILCLGTVWTSLQKVCLALSELTVTNRLMMSNMSYLLWVKLPEGCRVVVFRGSLFAWSGAVFDESPFGKPCHSLRKAYGAHVVCWNGLVSPFIPLCAGWTWTERIFWDSFEMKLPDWALVPQPQSVYLLDQLWCSPLWRGRRRTCNLYSEKPGPPGWRLLKQSQMAARSVDMRGILMWVNNSLRNSKRE